MWRVGSGVGGRRTRWKGGGSTRVMVLGLRWVEGRRLLDGKYKVGKRKYRCNSGRGSAKSRSILTLSPTKLLSPAPQPRQSPDSWPPHPHPPVASVTGTDPTMRPSRVTDSPVECEGMARAGAEGVMPSAASTWGDTLGHSTAEHTGCVGSRVSVRASTCVLVGCVFACVFGRG